MILESDNLKYRRLGCEQAIAKKGFKTFKSCSEACQEYADKHGIDCTFSSRAISHFVNGNHDISSKRLMVLMAVLGVGSIKELSEKYIAPKTRGCGQLWRGEYGSIVIDYDATNIKAKFD